MQLNNIVILIIVFINKVKFIAKSTIIQLCTYFAKKIYTFRLYKPKENKTFNPFTANPSSHIK